MLQQPQADRAGVQCFSRWQATVSDWRGGPFRYCLGHQMDVRLGQRSRSNSVGCFSPDAGMVSKDADYTYGGGGGKSTSGLRSLFNDSVTRRMKNLTDRLSKTVAVSESIAGTPDSADQRGRRWGEWSSQYSHDRTPNSNVPDAMWGVVAGSPYTTCVTTPHALCNGGASEWANLIDSARSKHSGGMNAGMADGAVQGEHRQPAADRPFQPAQRPVFAGVQRVEHPQSLREYPDIGPGRRRDGPDPRPHV
ncbi:MAG: DUF1559 domain-containing protein [Planctomycetes bacterium]|nr:DUF1559 domain-containing protein [Planctomycetota bacterium]